MKLKLMLCFVLLQTGFRCSEEEPGWYTVCDTPGAYKVVSSTLYLDSREFTSTRLANFFSRYLAYDERVEVDLTVVSDRRLLPELPAETVVRRADRPPDIEPVRTARPIAIFRKIGINAFFEFRNRKGQIERVVLRGQDVFSPVIDGMRPVVIGDRFVSHPEKDCIADSARDVIVYLPGLKDLSREQLGSVCRFYMSNLGPIAFRLSIYGSFEEAGSERILSFPAPQAMAGGFLRPRNPERKAGFSGYKGGGWVIMFENERPIWQVRVEPL